MFELIIPLSYCFVFKHTEISRFRQWDIFVPNRKLEDLNASFHQVGMLRPIKLVEPAATLYWSVCAKPGRWAVMYMCIRCINFVSISTTLRFNFGTVLTIWYFRVSFYYYINLLYFLFGRTELNRSWQKNGKFLFENREIIFRTINISW